MALNKTQLTMQIQPTRKLAADLRRWARLMLR